ncbi:anti-sigma factor family protein [Amycolatopsis cihanbeyliensis]|uniref:Putative zinc finger protein n=1 Tax=Amycolatopsis cihanbeyliensis TaxID=1128664 RepID=A0A542DF92_AMYCI|nr:zf-HC2 domain-containing protein [Amycolatopsis cihanbeyliensis]TQJ01726.1 putative zinc finger protein [Amycolatopsis cihanbeyliensis]
MSGARHRIPSLRCLRVMRTLQSHLDGEVDEDTSRWVAQHLEECRRCGLEADTYRAISDALAQHRHGDAEAITRLRAFGAALEHACDDHGC